MSTLWAIVHRYLTSADIVDHCHDAGMAEAPYGVLESTAPKRQLVWIGKLDGTSCKIECARIKPKFARRSAHAQAQSDAYLQGNLQEFIM